MTSLYQTLKDAGIDLDHYESDLYFPVNPQSTKILEDFKKIPGVSITINHFINNITKTLFYEVPFYYDPFWSKK